jgi:hypothetical protein
MGPVTVLIHFIYGVTLAARTRKRLGLKTILIIRPRVTRSEFYSAATMYTLITCRTMTMKEDHF